MKVLTLITGFILSTSLMQAEAVPAFAGKITFTPPDTFTLVVNIAPNVYETAILLIPEAKTKEKAKLVSQEKIDLGRSELLNPHLIFGLLGRGTGDTLPTIEVMTIVGNAQNRIQDVTTFTKEGNCSYIVRE